MGVGVSPSEKGVANMRKGKLESAPFAKLSFLLKNGGDNRT